MELLLKNFLEELSKIKTEYDEIRNKEEKFNIFTVLHKFNDERRLHSRFIAFLLNTDGSHEQNDLFLKKFLEQTKVDFITKNVKVFPNEYDKSEKDNIDIFILGKKRAIIIENKIWAGDSNHEDHGQLEGYFEKVRDDYNIPSQNIIVYYLTLDGHRPSNESCGKYKGTGEMNLHLISYGVEIIQWLKESLEEIDKKHKKLKDAIVQYIKLLEKMTHNRTSVDERIRIRDFIGCKPEYLSSAKYLLDNFKHIKWHTIFDFWNELKEKLQEKGFEILKEADPDAITKLTHSNISSKNEEQGIDFKINDNLNGTVWQEKDADLYWGFELPDNNDFYKKKLDELKKEKTLYFTGKTWGKDIIFNNEKIHLKNFESDNTFRLISKDFRTKLIEEIVNEILDLYNEKIK